MGGRTKIPVAMRLAPDVKAEAERRAAETRRTFTSYIEWLIMEDADGHKSRHTQPKNAGTQSA